MKATVNTRTILRSMMRCRSMMPVSSMMCCFRVCCKAESKGY